MPDPLTERQAKTLHFVGAFIDKLGYAPTLQQIGDYVGTSKHTVFETIEHLIRKEYMTKVADVPRALRLSNAGQAWYDARDWHPNLNRTCAEHVTQHAMPGVE